MTNANDDSPSTGKESSDASVDYQKLGQTLLSQELERHAYDVREKFMEVSVAVGHGADRDEDVVVFLIGMRINAFWKVHRWLPVFLVENLREAME